MKPLHLFDAVGVELEYMLIHRESGRVFPAVDQLFTALAGSPVSDIERGEIDWSNELVNHVLELKTHGPRSSLSGLASAFHTEVIAINQALESMHACLMPSAAHPFMDPPTETMLWPHEHSPIYQLYDTVFGCKGHGWSNLQSVHINLPFQGDEEFARLHAAIRVVLPLIPAWSASSPILDGVITPFLDARMHTYMGNQSRLPPLTGRLIPEAVFSESEYREKIFGPIALAMAPFDPDQVSDPHFLNSRGAIARFDRQAIEIRVMDIQECPAADVALVDFWMTLIRHLCDNTWSDFTTQAAQSTEALRVQFLAAIRLGEQAPLVDSGYAKIFGQNAKLSTTGDLLQQLLEHLGPELQPSSLGPLNQIRDQGPLARRMLQSVGPAPTRETLHRLGKQLCTALADNTAFA